MKSISTLQLKHLLMILVSLLLCLYIATAVVALEEPSPQYRNIAPLPGGGIALNAEGEPDGLGAMQINIPVAYTPGWGFANLGVYKGTHDHVENVENDNGSGILSMGFFGYPRVYMSGMQVSHIWAEAKAVSGQVFLMPETDNRPAFSLGMQDILMKEKGNRSLYGVFTKSVQVGKQDIFATAGYGAGRFLNHPFAGLSAPMGDKLNLAAEWDGFQLNAGIGWRPGGRDGKVTLLGARNFRTGWLIGIGAAIDFTPKN